MKQVIFAACAAYALSWGSPATAHAFLDRASPPVGSTVRDPPPQVKLKFTQELEPAFSTLTVQDSSGKRIDKGDARIAADTMQVSLPVLQPGRYKVTWRALSVDTHVTEGDFTFEVAR
jgi:methionine-rich copper-binding protein CopC